MSRGMHRHRSIRLANLATHKSTTRARKAPGKVKARVRKDSAMVAYLKAAKPETGYSALAQSWISTKLDKPFSRCTADEIKSLIV